MSTIGRRFVLLKNSLVRADQAGQKTAEGEEGDGYSVHTYSNISSISSVVQPSGGLMSPLLMSMASMMMGILHMSSFLISLYLISCTVSGRRSSTLMRFVSIRIFLKFDPVVVLTSDLVMLYSCLKTGLVEFLMLKMNLRRFLIKVVLIFC